MPSVFQHLARLRRLERRRQAIAGGAAALLLLVAVLVGLAVAGTFSGSSAAPAPTPTPKSTATATPTPTPPPTEPTLIDGVLVYPDQLKKIQTRLPLAVMFDNIVAARPQVGLDKAELVFEAVAEGGITRFLAVYWRNEPRRIVPVRSARVYYLDWAAELDSIFVHWGFARSDGPADVPSAIKRLGLRDFDGFYYDLPYFDRAPDRVGPHDGIADTAAIWQAAASYDWKGPPKIEPWQFKDDQPKRAKEKGARTANVVDLGFGGPFFSDYAVRWEYSPKGNSYLRSQGGAPHHDGRSRKRIEAKNVAVMITSVHSAGDGTAHLLYQTTGSGEAVVFQDGVATAGTWSKPDPHSRARFFDAEGKEIAFNRGQTWVEVLTAGDPLTY